VPIIDHPDNSTFGKELFNVYRRSHCSVGELQRRDRAFENVRDDLSIKSNN